jgi:hypothetical protein
MSDMSVDSGIFFLADVSYQMLCMTSTCVLCRTVCVHSRVRWLRAVMCVFKGSCVLGYNVGGCISIGIYAYVMAAPMRNIQDVSASVLS